MTWWTFDKQDGIIEYKFPKDHEPKAKIIDEITEELGFYKSKTTTIGIFDKVRRDHFFIEGYEQKGGERKVPFFYLLVVHIGSFSIQNVFLENFSNLIDFLKYISSIPQIFTFSSDNSIEVMNLFLEQISKNINNLRNED